METSSPRYIYTNVCICTKSEIHVYICIDGSIKGEGWFANSVVDGSASK